MPTMDATAKTAVISPAFAAAYFVYLDIVGDPLRFTTFGIDTTVSGSGDSELDGSYPAFGGKWLDLGDVNNSDSGSETLIITLSGIISMDTALLNEIGDRTKWQGRVCRIWCRLYDESGLTPQGAIFPLYTGYASSVKIMAEPDQQMIQMSVENWRAAFNQASNRSYLNQQDYDSGDLSAAATIAASNGLKRDTGAGAGSSDVGGGSYGVGPGGNAIGFGDANYMGGSYNAIGQDGITPGAINQV